MIISILRNLVFLAFAGLGAYAIFSNGTLSRDRFHRQIIVGLLMGVTVYLISSNPFVFEGAQIPLDAKAGLLVYAGYLGGALGGLIAAACGAVARFDIGGPNVWLGTFLYGLFALFGAGVARTIPSPVWPVVPLKATFLLIIGTAVLQFTPAPFVRWNEDEGQNFTLATAGTALVVVSAFSAIAMSFVIHWAYTTAAPARQNSEIRQRLRNWTTAANNAGPIKAVLGLQENPAFPIEIDLAEARLNTATRIAGIGFYTFNADTQECVFCSERHAAHFGLTPMEFQTKHKGPALYLGHIHNDDRQIVLDAHQQASRGLPQTYEYRAFHQMGGIRYIRQIEEPVHNENGQIVEYLGTSLDMTDLRQAEMRLRQMQRIEAIGTHTNGIAHDFNNLLTVILGSLEIWLEKGKGSQGEKLISSARKAALRGAELTKNLLRFAHDEPPPLLRLNLNELIGSTLSWTAGVLPATITLETSLFARLWDIETDPVSAENAILNLILNARDAMPDGGTIRIETANLKVTPGETSRQPTDIGPGHYVVLTVGDTGHGIAADKIKQIFEPFYTDKPRGNGSGLGLCMVKRCVDQSGGVILLNSEVGKGTTFRLYFNAKSTKAAPAEKEPVKATGAQVPQTNQTEEADS